MRRLPAALPLLAAALVAAAAAPGGSANARHHYVWPAASHAGPHSRPTLRGNKKATRRESRRLMRLAPLPEGATPTDSADGLTAPGMGSADSDSFVDSHRLWHVDEPMTTVFRWINHHRPEGLRTEGGGSGGSIGKPPDFEDVAWGEPNRSYAVNLELDMSVAKGPHGKGTTIRADGDGEWLDPRPMLDNTPDDQRLRVTTAAGCPASDQGKYSVVASSDSGLTHQLLPAASPARGLVCVYGGTNYSLAMGLAKAIHLSQEQAAEFAGRVQRLRLSHEDGGITSWPMDDGSALAVALWYPHQADVDLWLSGGCPCLTNGSIRTGSWPSLPKSWQPPARPDPKGDPVSDSILGVPSFWEAAA